MRKYPVQLFVSGVFYHLLHTWYLALMAVICVVLALIRWTAFYPVAAGLAAIWIFGAFAREKATASEYEREDADPAFVAAVDEEFKNRFEPKD